MLRYERRKEIGSGAFAKVYLGFDKLEKKEVAIKRVLRKKHEYGIDWTALREVKLLFELNHPNVVRLVGVFSEKGDLNMVMELCPLDLEKVIKSPVTLREADIKAYIRMAICGISACHSNFFLHRDIKPGNLLIGVDRQVKVADFGLAKVFGNPDPKDTDTVVTLPYRAPELLFGARKYSPAVDMWAIGCTFAELMIREVFLPGVDENDQLGKIFYTFGTPTEENWPNFELLPKFVRFTPFKPPPLKKRFPAASDDAMDLLKKFMLLNPIERISAKDSLNHRFFTNGEKETLPKDLPFEEVIRKK